MKNILAVNGSEITMSSLELVDFINEHRKQQAIDAGAEFPSKEFSKLEHKSFLAKVPLVLGIELAKYFAGQYKAGNGQLQPCYIFPKREACLMAMSYSYDIQAKVFDRMTALEESAVSIPKVKDVRIQALIENLIRLDAVEQEQARQSSELARLQETVAVVEARTQPENKHFTVLGYANLVGQKIDISEASKLGRQCANLSREQGLPIGDVSDPRFGRVHSYHESVLRSVVGGV